MNGGLTASPGFAALALTRAAWHELAGAGMRFHQQDPAAGNSPISAPAGKVLAQSPRARFLSLAM
jgi:hypothetical protein